MADDVHNDAVDELRDRVASLERELAEARRERDAALTELAATAGQAAVVARQQQLRDMPESDDVPELCAFCDGEGTYWVHDFEMKCRRCDGSGFSKHQANPLPMSER